MGLVLNWLGAGSYAAKLDDGYASENLPQADDAWRSGRTELHVETKAKSPFTLRVRIPAHGLPAPELLLNGKPVPNVDCRELRGS
jgi:DUF1680 family protein